MSGWRLWVFAALTLHLSFFFQLGTLPFTGADEPRYARIAEEMWLSGDYVTPTLNHRAWLEKPPLLYWIEAVSYSFFGVSEATARLPVAVLALLTLLFSCFVIERTSGLRPAILSGLILATSPLFLAYARANSTDMPLTACLSAAILMAFLAARSGGSGWALGTGALLGLAILAKGPIALVLFGGIFTLWCFLTERIPWNARQLSLAAVGFMAVGIPWYWLVWKANGYDFVVTFFINHHLIRFLTPIHRHVAPFWYYLPVLMLGFFPWFFFLGPSLVRLWRSARERQLRDPFRLLLWLWVLVPVIFFSMGGSKLAGYILPVFPALAMIAGMEWDRILSRELTTFRSQRIQWALLGALTVLLVLGLLIGGRLTYGSLGTGLLLAIPIASGFAAARHMWQRQRLEAAFIALVGMMAAFAGLAYWQAAPLIGNYHSAKELALDARPHLSESEPLLFYRYFHHTAHYYTGYLCKDETIPGIDELRAYMVENPQKRYLLLTQQQGLLDLQLNMAVERVRNSGNVFLVELSPAW